MSSIGNSLYTEQSASSTTYDNTSSGLDAVNIQDAIDELAGISTTVTTLVRSIRITADSFVNIAMDSVIRVVNGTNQINIVIGSLRVQSSGNTRINGSLRITTG